MERGGGAMELSGAMRGSFCTLSRQKVVTTRRKARKSDGEAGSARWAGVLTQSEWMWRVVRREKVVLHQEVRVHCKRDERQVGGRGLGLRAGISANLI